MKKPDLRSITESMFWLAILAVAIIVVASFKASAMSLYDYAIQIGNSPEWAICLIVVVDGAVLAGHFVALWLGISGHRTFPAMALVWCASLISVSGNFLHAPIESSGFVTLPFCAKPLYYSQIAGALMPLVLVATFSLIMHTVELRLHAAKIQEDRAAKRAERTARKCDKRSARNSAIVILPEEVQALQDQGFTKAQIAKKKGVSPRTLYRELKKVAH